MGQFSVEKTVLPGSALSGNQHAVAKSGDPGLPAHIEPSARVEPGAIT
jgi:hypothetical protein